MATPADLRLLELLDKWLKSLELHFKYSSLDDDSYWKIQPWMEHQRPSRWIIDLAKQKTIALQKHVQERVKMGDAKFSDALELMTFLANLVGSQHIERFIPIAEPDSERLLPLAPVGEAAQTHPGIAITATREMPKFVATKPPTSAPRPPPVARSEQKPAATKTSASDAVREQVIADAARLVQWGRKWYELAEVIARMADRPALPEIRRILKDHKATIEKMAGRA